MKRNIYLLLLGSLLIAAVLLWTERNARIEPPDKLTRVEMPYIADAVEFYWISTSTFPPALTGSNKISLYESLTSTNNAKRFLTEYPRWDEAHKLVDQWGNEFRVQAFMSTNRDGTGVCQLKVWSCGPNGQDQLGKGDNIEYVRTWPKKP